MEKKDGAVYDLVQSKGSPIDSPNRGPHRRSFLLRSTSAEHLYSTADSPRVYSTTDFKKNNTRSTMSELSRAARPKDNPSSIVRNFEAQQQSSPEDGGCSDGIYTQVVLKKKDPGMCGGGWEGGKSNESKRCGDESRTRSMEGNKDGDQKGSHSLLENQGLVVTYHPLPSEHNRTEESVFSIDDIEHTVLNGATYAVVHSSQKKKKKKKVDGGSLTGNIKEDPTAVASRLSNEPSNKCSGDGGVIVSTGEETSTNPAAAAVVKAEVVDEDKKKKVEEVSFRPPKPQRYLKKSSDKSPLLKQDAVMTSANASVNLSNLSNSAMSKTVSGPCSSQRNAAQVPSSMPWKASGPCSGPITLPSPTESTESPPCLPQGVIHASAPPSFPPPPPPYSSPPPHSPPLAPSDKLPAGVKGHTYEAVQRPMQRKHSSSVNTIDDCVGVADHHTPFPNQRASENVGGKKGAITEVQRAPVTTKKPHRSSSKSLSSSSFSSKSTSPYIRKDGQTNAFNSEERMRKNSSLPPRKSPPPPPATPTSSTPVDTWDGSSGTESKRSGVVFDNESLGNDPQFLFSPNYASNLIKVRGLLKANLII